MSNSDMPYTGLSPVLYVDATNVIREHVFAMPHLDAAYDEAALLAAWNDALGHAAAIGHMGQGTAQQSAAPSPAAPAWAYIGNMISLEPDMPTTAEPDTRDGHIIEREARIAKFRAAIKEG